MRTFDSVPNRLLPCVRVWPKSMHCLRRSLTTVWRVLLDVWLWNFRDIHRLLNTADKVRQMWAITGKRNSKKKPCISCCSEANDMFHSLNLTNKWNIPQGHRADAFGIVCFNCDSSDHTSDKCPHPRDEAKITKAKEVRVKSIGKGPGSGSRGHGRGRGDGHSGHRGDGNITRGKWGANKGAPSTPGTNTSLGDIVRQRNGKWMMNCKSCGWNESHTSKYRDEWNQNQSTFSIPVTFVFWSKLGKTPSPEKRPIPAARSASSGVFKGQLSGLINQYKTETEDGAFSSFLSEFEGLLN
jgi:hypothetical protein